MFFFPALLAVQQLLFPRARLPLPACQVVGQGELEDGESLFQWLMSPVDVETFYDAIHEDEPLLVTRPNNRTYFDGLFSKAGERRRLHACCVPRVCSARPVSVEGAGFEAVG